MLLHKRARTARLPPRVPHILAAGETCSFVNAARVDIVRLGIHHRLHSVKVRDIFWERSVDVAVLKRLASPTFPARLFLSKKPLIFLNGTNRELRRRQPVRRAIDLVPANPVVIAMAQNGPGISRGRGARGRRVVVTAVEARLHRRLLAAKHHGTVYLREFNHPSLSVVAQSASQPVLRVQGDQRNLAKLTLVLHIVLCMDRIAKVRENLHQDGLKLGRLLAMGHGTAAGNRQRLHGMKTTIAAKKHALYPVATMLSAQHWVCAPRARSKPPAAANGAQTCSIHFLDQRERHVGQPASKPLKAALLRSTAARSNQRTRVSMNALLFFRGQATIWKKAASSGAATAQQRDLASGFVFQTLEKRRLQVGHW